MKSEYESRRRKSDPLFTSYIRPTKTYVKKKAKTNQVKSEYQSKKKRTFSYGKQAHETQGKTENPIRV